MTKLNTFLYHDIVSEGSRSGFQRESHKPYVFEIDEFIRHIGLFATSPVKPSLITKDLGFENKAIALTFDDGGCSFMTIADIIEQCGWHGYFFITTQHIGEEGFVSKKDIVDLHRRGHIIGTHTHTHTQPFVSLSRNKMIAEWKMSISILESIIDTKVTHASIPGGTLNRLVEQTANDCGIKHLFTSEPSLETWHVGDMTCYGRVCPKRNTSLIHVNRLIHFQGYHQERLIRFVKNSIKRAIGRV